jgi:hypothetical protein
LEGFSQRTAEPNRATGRGSGSRRLRKRPGRPSDPDRGYYFHILTAQGKNAPGAAESYLVNGKMTAGFAFVAYPAEYRSSGVMTFIVGGDGIVHEKDLGKRTEAVGKAIKEYNPDASWRKSEGMQAQSAKQLKF